MDKNREPHELKSIQRRAMMGGAILCLMALVLPASAAAQSTDRDNPTPLASNEVRGHAIGKKVEYYYTFLAGPGEVILMVDSGAKGSFSQLDAQLFDFDAQKLAQVQNLPYPGETSRKVTRATFGVQQPVLLRIFLDYEAAQYLVRLSGSVQVGGGDVSFSGSAATSATPTPSESVPGASSEAAVPSQPVVTSTDSAEPAGKATGLKKLWLKLSSVGEVLGLAGVGALHVEMKDGTAQDIELTKIKKVLVGGAPSDGSNVTASGEDKSTSWQRLWLKLGTAGELAVSNGRSLRLEMNDGTVQEFNAARVKKISLKK
jgi:hypothetical protein